MVLTKEITSSNASFIWVLLLYVLLAPLVNGSPFCDSLLTTSRESNLLLITTALLLSIESSHFGFPQDGTSSRRPPSKPHNKRTRRPINSIFKELGSVYVKRAYRMHETTFWRLHRILHPYLAGKLPTNGRKRGQRMG